MHCTFIEGKPFAERLFHNDRSRLGQTAESAPSEFEHLACVMSCYHCRWTIIRLLPTMEVVMLFDTVLVLPYSTVRYIYGRIAGCHLEPVRVVETFVLLLICFYGCINESNCIRALRPSKACGCLYRPWPALWLLSAIY